MLQKMQTRLGLRLNRDGRQSAILAVAETSTFFEKFPEELVRYIETAYAKRISVVSAHLLQFTKLAGFPLIYKGREVRYIPQYSFLKPWRFDNIKTMISITKGRPWRLH